MISWNPEALELFQRHCEDRRAALLAAAADPDEVFSDWKGLIESRAASLGESEVAAARVRSGLADLFSALNDLPPADPPPPAAPPPAASPSAVRVWFHRGATIFLWLLGVALPLGVLLFELTAGFCSEILFDPVPTWAHVLLIGLVPVANAWALLAASRTWILSPQGRLFRWVGLLNGIAIGVSAFYALQFAIVTPFAAMAVIYFGVGLIPLAPLLSFVSALVLRTRLHRARRLTQAPPPAAGWRSALPAFLLMILLGTPQWIVQAGAARANDPDPAVRVRAVRLLRACGDRDLLLRKCYRRSENIDLASLMMVNLFGFSPSTVDAQNAYYRVTGSPFNAVPPPRLKGFRGQALIDDSWFDPALGGEQVAARIKNLSLSQSRLDGRVDTASGIAYLEWTLEFRNASQTAREARALIELPPGGVVSRVTLWINGEPCEAAFGGRSQTRQAYQQVAVRQRRDPVLVTTAGPDRVLLQCFPVPVDGSMKTRIGITVPLAVPDARKSEALLRLPAFAEQNFSAARGLNTSVWLESDRPALSAGAGLVLVQGAPLSSVQGDIPADSPAPAPVVRLPLAQPVRPVLARDNRLHADSAILQTLEVPAAEPAFPAAIAIVIDGSARMKPHAGTLRRILEAIPPATQQYLVLASDEPESTEHSLPDGFLRFAGGCDNGAALGLAAKWAAAHGHAPVLWLHAAQPLESSDLEALRQIADFSRGRLAIHSHQFGPGADRVSEKLADLQLIHPVPGVGDPVRDIPAALRGDAARWQREVVSGDAIPPGVSDGSSHVVRLWAAGEIARLTQPYRKTGRDEALELARTFQLVTPISGAVVLETAAQYKAHDLTPADPATAPGIVPEPGTLGLLLLGGPLLLALRRRKCTAPAE